MSSQQCRFFNKPGGCRFGNRCKYLHEGNPRSGPSTVAGGDSMEAPGAASSPRSTNAPQGGSVPPGVCPFFWNTGDCSRGFSCRRRHERPASASTSSALTSSDVPSSLVPFLTPAGLSRLTDAGSDSLFAGNLKPRSPTEVHNSLKMYLYDNYHFRHAFDMHGFLSLLLDATTNNSSWTTEDGQLLLSAVAKGNGLQRINDILSWEKVSPNPGSDRTLLSFQRGYVALLQYMSSDFVIKSILSHLINALYMMVMEHFDTFSTKFTACMETIMQRKSFKEPGPFARNSQVTGGTQVFGPLSIVLLQCLTRIKHATAKHPQLRPLVQSSSGWLNIWIEGVTAATPTFSDSLAAAPLETRKQICQHLRNKYDQLVAIVDREHTKAERGKSIHTVNFKATSDEGILAALHNSYVGPGVLRPEGPRHDNDHVDIADIRIAPTHEELVCRIPPFLPATLYGAPHPSPPDSPERLLDIQFRLLREELTAPLRTSVQLLLDDLAPSNSRTQLNEVIGRKGGKYRGHSDNQDTALFNVYTNVEFSGITPDRKGLSVNLSIDTPPGRARQPDANRRARFWESMSSKRLMSGGLVALIWQRSTGIDVHLGTITSSLRDHVASSRQGSTRLAIRVAFFDTDVQLRILQELRRPEDEREGLKILVEATVMFASIRPFLEALRIEPTTLPFNRYLVLHPPETLQTIAVNPPAYAAVPGFSFQLTSLFPPEAGIDDLSLVVGDPTSVENARVQLRQHSRLDPSQADAVVDALVREVSLMQGPPGTGKSYTGVEFLRVLLNNKVRPILMIAFTNHALDHMLCSVLDTGITKKVVRMGSRSSDPRIQEFNIEAMEEVAGKSRLDRAFSQNYREVKDMESKIKELMQECLDTTVNTESILRHIELAFPIQFNDFLQPPPWIQLLHTVSKNNDDEWTQVGKGGRDKVTDNTLYGYWLRGADIDFLNVAHYQQAYVPAAETPAVGPAVPDPSPATNRFDVLAGQDDVDSDEAVSVTSSDLEIDEVDFENIAPEERWMYLTGEDNEDVVEMVNEAPQQPAVPPPPPVPEPQPHAAANTPIEPPTLSSRDVHPSDFFNLQEFFTYFGYQNVPSAPATDRPLSQLVEQDDAAWSLSREERQRLHNHWVDEVRIALQENRIAEFERLRKMHNDAVTKYNEGRAQARCELLRNVDIIGCTTTGAANLTSLLEAISPKVMLVEEAGQVLEAHILGSLVPSVQHMILIGDPLQLRPTINNFALSVEHKNGGKLYKFDMSLMERLSSSGFPMSQIDVQRRMRPDIADLVRRTLYPKLEDHALVKEYPDVQGMHRNVYFFDHRHKENGGDDDTMSRYNQFEVDMIVDLVMYLLRQGPYSSEGDIVVLCAYLGQLARMRDALSDKVAVVIDERDQRELADREGDQEESEEGVPSVEHVKVSRRVRLRTIDNYQGEEAKIVILSLVRNSGGADGDEVVHGHSSMTRANVGFLKSENRTNVALSRAREGMYILGNARDLRLRSSMWRTVLSILEEKDCIGTSIPVICSRHPEHPEHIKKPGQLPRIAPDGGCLRQCDSRLSCGHICPFKCHSDDPKHLSVKCDQRCTRLCVRGHPCLRACAEPCGDCTAPVSQVELPCGHVKPQVPCYALDNLSAVSCDVLLTRKLPNCEHEVQMRCSDDPNLYRCRAACKGIMSCCGRNCRASCSECQDLNRPTEETEEPIVRKVHRQHPCQKRLYCEHQCDRMCSNEHECTTECKKECRQSCAHARCRLPCSVPCAPCQEPCLWRCAHHVCPLPCGSICARLPCDIRCPNVLACGHRCPSVCGEDCSIQICPACADGELKDVVVDLIMQSTLEDIDPDYGTLDMLLITLPNCRHVFTAETLDGHCSMTDYYKQNEETGQWLGLEAPPVGFRKPPTCPTCRAPITANRYGRVFKRADLDILENNVVSRMSASLATAGTHLQSAQPSQIKEQLQREAKNDNLKFAKPTSKAKKRAQNQAAFLKETRKTPLPVRALDACNDDLHGIPIIEGRAWRFATRPYLEAYRTALDVAGTRSAHLHAWEASFAYLYQHEIDLAMQFPEKAPRNPHEHAMRMARLNVGQPQPRADKRFLVEAFWMTINVRLALVELAKEWSTALSSRSDYPQANRRLWEHYIVFMLRTCAQDAKNALDITVDSESHRQTVKTSLMLMRIKLEQFRFNVEVLRRVKKFTEERDKLVERVEKLYRDAVEQRQWVEKNHLSVPRPRDVDERAWLQENFCTPADTLISEWEKVKSWVIKDGWYEPMSLEEMQGIVRGLGFSHTGHFYKCPNGHTFVIGDCGGATVTSFCPECSAPIGGTGHNLLSSNSRAMEYEEIARAQGSQRSPWNWGV